MFHEEDREEPASVMLTINSGQNYDIKNLPGFKRKQLIENGEASIDSFVQADNMPGYKLKKMRDRFRENNNLVDSSIPFVDIKTLTVDSLVSYRNIVTEAKKINVEKGLVYIKIKGKKEGWVKVEKLKPVIIPPNEEE